MSWLTDLTGKKTLFIRKVWRFDFTGYENPKYNKYVKKTKKQSWCMVLKRYFGRRNKKQNSLLENKKHKEGN